MRLDLRRGSESRDWKKKRNERRKGKKREGRKRSAKSKG